MRMPADACLSRCGGRWASGLLLSATVRPSPSLPEIARNCQEWRGVMAGVAEGMEDVAREWG